MPPHFLAAGAADPMPADPATTLRRRDALSLRTIHQPRHMRREPNGMPATAKEGLR